MLGGNGSEIEAKYEVITGFINLLVSLRISFLFVNVSS